MSLKIKRGTNSQRLSIVPDEGELVYTLDTKKLYVGDGVTSGGNSVSAAYDQSLNTIDRVAFDRVTATQFRGSVYTPNGRLMIDYATSSLYPEYIRTDSNGNILFKNPIPTVKTCLRVQHNSASNTADERSEVRFVRHSVNPTDDFSTQEVRYGTILFGRNDVNGDLSTGVIVGRLQDISILHNLSGQHYESDTLTNREGRIGIATYTPNINSKLDVRGAVYISSVLKLSPLNAEPSVKEVGMIAVADNTTWNPSSKPTGNPYPVFYDGTTWINFY